jgi:hypothetical protein
MATDENLKIMLIFLVGLLLVGVLTYSLTTNIHGKRESAKIAEKNAIIQEKELEIQKLKEKRIQCADCHGEVIDFHTVKQIAKLDEIRGKNPRICTLCHGLNVHDIHQSKLKREELRCETCHIKDGKFTKPVTLPGDLLVCEQCHYKGNYIDIHITYGTGACTNCHLGDVGNIHKPTMANVSEVLKKGISTPPPVSPSPSPVEEG